VSEWVIEPLGRQHDRSGFDCGQDSLNDYLLRYASQHMKKGVSRSYVALPVGGGTVLAYYTLSTASIVFSALPTSESRKLPPHPIPAVHIGRLAVDQASQGDGLGSAMLIDALARSLRVADEVGVYAVTVEALNDAVRTFYLRHGFASLDDHPRHLYIPLKAVRKLGLD